MNTAILNPAITPETLAPTRFAHDCSNCLFLRSVFLCGPDTNRTEQFDVYRCQRGNQASFIARYGSDGPEYTSCPEDMIGRISSEIPENQAIKIVFKEWEQCQTDGVKWDDFVAIVSAAVYINSVREQLALAGTAIIPEEPVSF